MKAVVGAFNQEKALVGASSVIVQLRWLIVCRTSSSISEQRADLLAATPLVFVGESWLVSCCRAAAAGPPLVSAALIDHKKDEKLCLKSCVGAPQLH